MYEMLNYLGKDLSPYTVEYHLHIDEIHDLVIL